jgi:hypothetical protein
MRPFVTFADCSPTLQYSASPFPAENGEGDPEIIAVLEDLTAAAASAASPSDKSIDENLCCKICGSPEDWSNMLLCEECYDGFHTYCVG